MRGVNHSITQLHHVRAAAQSKATHYCSAVEHNHNKTTPFHQGRRWGQPLYLCPAPRVKGVGELWLCRLGEVRVHF